MPQTFNRMTRPSVLFLLGAFATIVGCFLPWVGSGDVVYYTTPGIVIRRSTAIDPVPQRFLTVIDNGGVLIILLCAILLLLVFKAPAFIDEPSRFVLPLSIVLVLLPLYHISVFIKEWPRYRGTTDAYNLLPGLVIVLMGTITLLIAGVRLTRQK